MFVAILCYNVPVSYPILPRYKFWERPISRMTSSTIFGRMSRRQRTKSSVKRSKKFGNRDSMANHKTWEHLEENSSTKHLAWPEATHRSETVALSEFPSEEGNVQGRDIRIQKRFGFAQS